MLITVDAWLSRQFGSVRPARSTLMTWIRQGRLPATKIAGRYYVDESLTFAAFLQQHAAGDAK